MEAVKTQKTVTLTLTLEELELILEKASELPFKTIAPTMMKIQQQATETLAESAVKNTDTNEPSNKKKGK
ncbi:hypothetical protein [Phaeodactylibacter xiamenensis]|jgi:hypothetical protein|uniref:hypothetical protein n=1 Tax=Phaeodactylibacter xiamenensis TaxID=1524460 RepID=UPI003CCC20EC